MSELDREAPVGRFFDGHGFDVRSTKHKPAVTGREISAVYVVLRENRFTTTTKSSKGKERAYLRVETFLETQEDFLKNKLRNRPGKTFYNS